jgi:hypothetical protein
VQVRHDEGVAIHIGPEPCAFAREGRGEASAGERAGQPLSRERNMFRAPTPYPERKAIPRGTICARPGGPGVVGDPGMCARSLHGNREISRVTACASTPVRIGKVRSRSR